MNAANHQKFKGSYLAKVKLYGKSISEKVIRSLVCSGHYRPNCRVHPSDRMMPTRREQTFFQRRINTKLFLEEKFKMGNNSSRCYDPKDLPSMYRNVLSDVTCIRENSKEFDQSCKMDCENCEIANCDCEEIAISQITQFDFQKASHFRK